jgi:histidinol-phosphate aminotransferase
MNARPLGVRPDLADLAPYISPQLPAKVRLNTNESPYPPPKELVDEVAEALRSEALNRYPERDANALVDGLAERTGWPREGLWIANGSNEVFLHLFLAFGGPERTCLTFEPTYSLFSNIARIAGTKVAAGARGPDWEVADDTVREALELHDPDIVVFCSPNNPTGAIESTSAIEAALEHAAMVVVDEAYIEFASPGSSFGPMLEKHSNLVIVNTFSKAWSLAGVRLGYLRTTPGVIEELLRVRLPYHLSTFTQLAGVAALGHEDDGARRVAAIAAERDRIVDALGEMGLGVYPSSANFVLFETGDRTNPDPDRSAAIWQKLLDRGVLVRHYPSSPVLASTLRVTAGLPEETDAFLEALRTTLEEM